MVKPKTAALLLLVLTIILGATGCRGYEDGPLVSTRTVENRLVGHWYPEKIIIGEMDLTSKRDSLFTGENEPIHSIYFFNDYSEANPNVFVYVGQHYVTRGVHSLRENNSKLFLSISSCIGCIPGMIWKISRLSSKHFELEATDSKNITYKVKFSKTTRPW